MEIGAKYRSAKGIPASCSRFARGKVAPAGISMISARYCTVPCNVFLILGSPGKCEFAPRLHAFARPVFGHRGAYAASVRKPGNRHEIPQC